MYKNMPKTLSKGRKCPEPYFHNFSTIIPKLPSDIKRLTDSFKEMVDPQMKQNNKTMFVPPLVEMMRKIKSSLSFIAVF